MTERATGTTNTARWLLFCAAALFLMGWAAAVLWNAHFVPHNDRIAYGMAHLESALLACALSFGVVGAAYGRIGGWGEGRKLHTGYLLLGIVAIYCAIWVPAWLSGGFAQDDWALLAAAATRKILYVHPGLSLWTLDPVDGNFRPLGTALYFGYMFKWFGMQARAFTLGPLAMTLLSGLVAVSIVRELGYSMAAAAVAALLYLSRGMLYTIVTWPSALGDSLAIALCGVTSLLVIRAIHRRGAVAAALHVGAWVVFVVATLAKQSAFVAPLVVGLILLMRPGRSASTTALGWRVGSAALGVTVYGATAAAVFFHAKALSSTLSPYPLGISAGGVLRTFSYVTWYLAVLVFPDRMRAVQDLPEFLGMGIVVLVGVMVRRRPQMLGPRPGDVAFAGLAALSSVSLFVLLQTRAAPYYGCMAAFWISIGLGVVLTETWSGSTRAGVGGCLMFVLLVLSGFGEIRLEQTGLLPSGGYLWGTFATSFDRRFNAYVENELARAPRAGTVLFENCQDRLGYPAMVLLDNAAVRRIVIYDDRAGGFFGNDRLGLRPSDGREGLTDPGAYNWGVPMDAAAVRSLLAGETTVRIPCRDGYLPANTQ